MVGIAIAESDGRLPPEILAKIAKIVMQVEAVSLNVGPVSGDVSRRSEPLVAPQIAEISSQVETILEDIPAVGAQIAVEKTAAKARSDEATAKGRPGKAAAETGPSKTAMKSTEAGAPHPLGIRTGGNDRHP